MSAVLSKSQAPAARGAGKPDLPWIPPGFDLVVFILLCAGYTLLYLPTFRDLSTTVWATDEQGHGPIILSVSAWLLFRARHEVAAVASQTRPMLGLGISFVAFALLLYAFGRSQSIILFEVSSQIPLLIGLLLIFVGPRALKVVWFPLFFLIFMVPLPSAIVSTLTTPLKSAVSWAAENILHSAGYPIGRAGVILTVGQYQLLVADACAGLNSMFTLEALGLLYLNLMGHTSAGRNIALAILIIPISFVANIVRVMILILVTFYFGDEAGQGFIHDFAGMVLFAVGLVLILVVDAIVGKLMKWWATRRRPQEQLA
jgi:exosortase B